jgi:hypothetical protein
MARPKKSKLPETVTPEVESLEKHISASVINPPEVVAEVPPPVAPSPVESKPNFLDTIQPEADRSEMSRYFCVINNSEQASRIMQAISHQRDLEMWGLHQYDNNRSRNSYSKSFYFKSRENAVIALEHANKLMA